MRLITVTPAGRRPYLEILVSYLLRNRHVIDEHHFWVNTRKPDDLAYMHKLVDRYPDFFKLVVKPMDPEATIGAQIWMYLSDCVEPDTIYLRLDDDICYIAEDAIEKMRDYRIANPDPFLILGAIVNNSICTHYFQKAGIIPESWGHVEEECMDAVGWKDPHFTHRLHSLFIRDLITGQEGRWKGVANSFDGVRRFSVNAICWRGEDLKQVAELHEGNVEEEAFLTRDLPLRFGRPNEICSNALFGHYSFFTQRKSLEMMAPWVLKQYRQIAFEGSAEALSKPSKFELMKRNWQQGLGRAKMGIRNAIHGLKNRMKPDELKKKEVSIDPDDPRAIAGKSKSKDAAKVA